MPLYRTEAVALVSRPGTEAERLVTLLTPRFGQVLARVAGVARTKSRYGSAMEQLSHTDLLLHKKTESQTTYRVTQCAIVHSHAALRADLRGVAVGSLVAEAVAALTHRDEPQPLIWALLVRTLDALERETEPWPALICFLAHLMRCAGYWPQWDRCVRTQQAPRGDVVFYWPEEGGVVDAAQRPPGAVLPSMRRQTWRAVQLLSTAKLAGLPDVALDAVARAEIWDVFDRHWRSHLDWESKALRFLRAVTTASR